ncbi:MAG: IS630 family transposase [Treponema sp.]|nr:IS630 family transposase [Treponema sp.]
MSYASKSAKKSKNQILQENDLSGSKVLIIITFLLGFLTITIARRLIAMLYILADVPVQRICVLTGLHEDTVYELRKKMQSATNILSLLSIKSGSGRKCTLDTFEESVKDELNSHNYHCRQQIADMILEKFGIRLRLSAISAYLKKWFFKRIKCASLPGKSSVQKQKNFYETKLLPFMRSAKSGDIVLLFMDGVHFVQGCDFLGYVWCMVRRVIKTSSGRNRYNVLGAIDYITKKVLTVTNDEYLNAKTVCEMLRKIAAEYPGQVIHIILDNAKYQKCKIVMELAEQLGIYLDYIPSYSPNLNLIERLWKFVKSELRDQFYNSFESFVKRIDEIIASTSDANKNKIDKLISDKVHFYYLRPVAENTYEELQKSSSRRRKLSGQELSCDYLAA